MEIFRPTPKPLTSRSAYQGDEAEAYFDALEEEIKRLRGEHDTCKPEAPEPDGIGWCSSCNKTTELCRPKCPHCGDWLVFAADDKPEAPEGAKEFPQSAHEWLQDALGRFQVTHCHSSIREALKAMDRNEVAVREAGK